MSKEITITVQGESGVGKTILINYLVSTLSKDYKLTNVQRSGELDLPTIRLSSTMPLAPLNDLTIIFKETI